MEQARGLGKIGLHGKAAFAVGCEIEAGVAMAPVGNILVDAEGGQGFARGYQHGGILDQRKNGVAVVELSGSGWRNECGGGKTTGEDCNDRTAHR